jgi:CRISPR-associated protein Cas2
MARRRYLVAYDIRDDRRLRSIAGCMEGYGTRIQYSVFVCDLSDREKVTVSSRKSCGSGSTRRGSAWA